MKNFVLVLCLISPLLTLFAISQDSVLPPGMAALFEKFETHRESELVAPLKKATDLLNEQYVKAIKSAFAKAIENGDLKTSLELQAEQKRIENAEPIDPAKPMESPEGIRLRKMLMIQLEEISNQHKLRESRFTAKKVIALTALQTHLVRNVDLEGASVVAKHIAELQQANETKEDHPPVKSESIVEVDEQTKTEEPDIDTQDFRSWPSQPAWPSEILAVQTRTYSKPSQAHRLLHIEKSGLADFSVALFATPNESSAATKALTWCNDELYGAGFLDSYGKYCHLVKFLFSPSMQTPFVSTKPIGYPAINGLAAVDDELYGVSVNEQEHSSSLIKIDKQTGVGSLVGETRLNVCLEALAYHPLEGKLYASSVPFWGQEENSGNYSLYQINLSNGKGRRIGDLGVELRGMAWHQELGLIGAFHKLYQIDPATGQTTLVNKNAQLNHQDHPKNGVTSLAAKR